MWHFIIMFYLFINLVEIVNFLGVCIRLESSRFCSIIISFKLWILNLCMQTSSSVTICWIVWLILLYKHIWNRLMIFRLIILKWFDLIDLLLNIRVESVLIYLLKMVQAVEAMYLMHLGQILLVWYLLHCHILVQQIQGSALRCQFRRTLLLLLSTTQTMLFNIRRFDCF